MFHGNIPIAFTLQKYYLLLAALVSAHVAWRGKGRFVIPERARWFKLGRRSFPKASNVAFLNYMQDMVLGSLARSRNIQLLSNELNSDTQF